MTIAAILGRKGAEVFTTTADTRVADAVALLADHRIGAVPVVEGSGIAGVFSERDVIQGLTGGGTGGLLDRLVRDVMTAPAVTVAPGDSVLGALSLMTQRRIRHLPVVDGDRLVGIVSIGDLVKYRIDNIEAEAAAMRDYIQQS